MPIDKDYTLSLNRGLYSVFHNKYVREAFNQIIDDVIDLEAFPEDEIEMWKWVGGLVEKNIGHRFKEHLMKQIVKSIKDAKPKVEYKHYDDLYPI